MSSEVAIGGEKLEPHRLRAAVLGEVHARPFTPLSTPARVLHFAFDTAGEQAQADRNALADLCDRRGIAPPRPADKHFHVGFGGTQLRWEQHSEFTTYTFELRGRSGRDAVSSGGILARLADGAGAAAGAAAGRHRSASDGRQAGPARGRAAFQPAEPRGRGKFRRHRGLCDRLSHRSGWLRAHPGARPRSRRRACRRAGAAASRTRNLSHARFAGAAESTGARALDQPDRKAAGGS